jgi:type IV pilus assembly protein PilC
MPVYQFEVMDAKGKKGRREVEAENLEDAKAKVRALNLFPTKVKEMGDAKSAAAPSSSAGKGGRKFVLGGVSHKQLTQFTSQLSTLQNAGLPIVRSLRILEGQMKPSKLKYQVADVADDVEGGSTFSEALAKHPHTFDKLYVSMVRAGEAGGVLDTILLRLSDFMEKSLKLRKKVIGASVYPIAVICVATLIMAGIMIFVIPSFQKMFEDMKMELPIVTTLLLTVAKLVASLWFLLFLVPILIVAGYRGIVATQGGRYFVDNLKLKIPIMGPIIRKSAISRFTRTLGTLISSGVPILEALNIVKEAVGNVVIAKAIEEVHGSIKEGESIAGPLRNSHVFDEVLINMIEVGEETGELDKMLIKIADNYDLEVDVTVDSMTSLLEPVLIVMMAGLVGFVVIALFMPLIKLIETMGNQ